MFRPGRKVLFRKNLNIIDKIKTSVSTKFGEKFEYFNYFAKTKKGYFHIVVLSQNKPTKNDIFSIFLSLGTCLVDCGIKWVSNKLYATYFLSQNWR